VYVCGSSSDVTLLAGIIVLEEFCKELAAIAFTKHYADSTSWLLASCCCLLFCQRQPAASNFLKLFLFQVITARCYAEHDIATASCLSVCPSICNIEVEIVQK